MSNGNGSERPPEGVAAKLDRVLALQSALRAEVRALGKRVEVLAEAIEVLTVETGVLGRAQDALDRALDFFEVQQKARVSDLEKAHSALSRALEVVEARTRTLRDEVADLAAVGEGG